MSQHFSIVNPEIVNYVTNLIFSSIPGEFGCKSGIYGYAPHSIPIKRMQVMSGNKQPIQAKSYISLAADGKGRVCLNDLSDSQKDDLGACL